MSTLILCWQLQNSFWQWRVEGYSPAFSRKFVQTCACNSTPHVTIRFESGGWTIWCFTQFQQGQCPTKLHNRKASPWEMYFWPHEMVCTFTLVSSFPMFSKRMYGLAYSSWNGDRHLVTYSGNRPSSMDLCKFWLSCMATIPQFRTGPYHEAHGHYKFEVINFKKKGFDKIGN